MTSRTLTFSLAAFAAVILGCGGGGGTDLVTGEVVYQTNWADSASSTGGESQRITLFREDGNVVKTLQFNRPGFTLQNVPLGIVEPGIYRLSAELFSRADLGGLRMGEVETLITHSGQTTLSTTVGSVVDGVAVTPDSATLSVPESRRFYATALSGGVATFSQQGAFAWETLGGVAVVNADGLVEARTAGIGSVRAQHLASGQRAAASITVEGSAPGRSKWTVLVFLNAANDLYTFANLNVNQMERVAGNADVRFVVQWKQSRARFPGSSFDGTRRYLLKSDETDSIASQLVQDLGAGVDMGRAQTLQDFVTWGKQFYPADRYVLVVWNHGSGWSPAVSGLQTNAVSFDDETGNSIQTWQLKQALAGHQLDIVAWDASLMQMAEVAYEVRDNARFVVGSEESPPGAGYPYHLVFDDFRDNPDGATSDLSRSFVKAMLEHAPYAFEKVTQSVIDTSKLPALATALDQFAGELRTHQSDLGDLIKQVRSQAQAYSPNPTRWFRDLDDVCQRIRAGTTITSVRQAASAVRVALADAVVWEGHNANSPGSRGLSIDFSPGDVFRSTAGFYAQMDLARQTLWDEFLSFAP